MGAAARPRYPTSGGPLLELGPYHLHEVVAAGGMAEVWRAVYEPTDTPLAVKVSSVQHPAFVEALHGEAAVMASFRSPYLAAVHDFGAVGPREVHESQGRLPLGAAWMAVEWVPHGVLTPELVTDWWALRRVTLDVLLGLAHAHAHGVLHRDVKPDNLLVASRSPLRVKLADFGIAFARERWLAEQTRPTAALSPRWSAPEQVRGELAAQGPWTDLYLVGVVVHHLLTGRLPFEGVSGAAALMKRQLEAELDDAPPRFEVPSGFEGWLRRLVQKRPRDRFLTAPEAIDALLALDRLTRLHRRHWSTESDPETPPPRGTDDPGPGVFANRRAPLVGREAERDRLWGLVYDVSVDRKPRAALIHGPSGVGSSALGLWLAERVLETGVATASVGRESGPSALRELVARHLGGSLRHTTDLAPALGVHFPDRDEDGVVELARWMSGVTDPPRTARFALAAKVLGQRGPCAVIVVEGFTDGELLAFARWVCAEAAFPALFVFVEADERLGREPPHPGLALERVHLEPLSPEATVRLVQSYGAVDQLTAVRVADRAAGLPGTAVEVLRSLATTGGLRPSATGWRASRRAPLPAPAAALERARTQLDELCKQVPRSLPTFAVAAALGPEGTVAEWELVAKQARILIPAGLVPALHRARLLGPRGGSVALTQPLLLDAAAERAADRLPALHRAAALVLESLGAEPARVGRQWYAAGDADAARPWLERGLARNLGLVSQGVCLDLLEQLVPADSVGRAPLLFKRIERARVAGRVDAAFEAIRKLLLLARRHDDPGSAARALMQRAVLRVEGGDDEGAVRDAREAARLGAAAGLAGEVAQTPDWLGLVLARTGRLAEATALLQGRGTYLALYGQACIAVDEGRRADALGSYEQAGAVVGEDPLNRALLDAAVADTLRELGRLDSAERLARSALDRLLDQQTTYVGDARVVLGFIHLAQARWAAAEVVLRPALSDNDDAQRAALVGLAACTAGLRRDPTGWLQLFDPRGLRMSLAMDQLLARTLDRMAGAADLPASARRLAEQHASVVLARAVPVDRPLHGSSPTPSPALRDRG